MGEEGGNIERKVDEAIANISALLESEHNSSGSEGDVEDVEEYLASDLELSSTSDAEDEIFN